MWTTTNNRQPAGTFRRLFQTGAVLLVLALPGIEKAARAQDDPAPRVSADSRGLRRAIERRYEVLPIREGVVLTPRNDARGVRSVEISGDTIAINGERVSEQILRDWLGAEDAAPVLRLQALSPAERRALFDLDTDDVAAPEAAPEEAPEEEATPEVEETPEPDGEDDDTTIIVEGEETPATPEETPEKPAEADDESDVSTGSQVKFVGNIHVDKGELAQEAVAIGGSVRVDGEVSRDVVAIGGPARINGRVGGDVVSVGGSVILGPGAVVEGDVNSIGGRIVRGEGAEIHGATFEGGPGWHDDERRGDRDFPLPFFLGPGETFFSLAGLVVLVLITWLALLAARPTLERIGYHVAHEPWKAGLVGFLFQLFFFPLLAVVSVILVITIVGCPLLLLLPFVILAVVVAAVLGFAAVAWRVGQWIEARFGWTTGGPYVAALIGVLLIQAWTVLGHLFGIGMGGLDWIAAMFLMFGFAVKYVAWTVGLGAALLSRFGNPQSWRFGRPPGTVPPVPPVTYPPAAPPADYSASQQVVTYPPETLPLSNDVPRDDLREDLRDDLRDEAAPRSWEEPPPPER